MLGGGREFFVIGRISCRKRLKCAVSDSLEGNREFGKHRLKKLDFLLKTMTPYLLPYLDKPFAFFGHSMGALISFELARYLVKTASLSPFHLFISGYGLSQGKKPQSLISNLPEAIFIEEIRRLNGTPQAVLEDEELMQLLLPILRADFSILETHIYQDFHPLTCPITVFGGLDDDRTTEEELQSWSQATQESFSLNMFPGDHFFIHSEESNILPIINKVFL